MPCHPSSRLSLPSCLGLHSCPSPPLSLFTLSSRVCHCITATLATLSATEDGSALIMTCPDDLALSTLLTLSEVVETPSFDRAGHVKVRWKGMQVQV